MTKKQLKFRDKVFAKALAMCGNKNEAMYRATCALECHEWRRRHDRHMKELKAIQKERLKH